MSTKVYIAGPYTLGDVAMNVRRAIKIGDTLATLGYTPYIPHLSHFWHLVAPRSYEFWLEYDLVWLKMCDCVLRLPGKSTGADAEVGYAIVEGMPVYKSMRELEMCEGAKVMGANIEATE